MTDDLLKTLEPLAKISRMMTFHKWAFREHDLLMIHLCKMGLTGVVNR